MAAAFLVASPDSEMVQHDRGCNRDIQRGCALTMLRNVHKSVTEFQLSSRQACALQDEGTAFSSVSECSAI